MLAALVFLVASMSTVARASPLPVDDATRNAARELAREGLELMQQERWREALDPLRRAYELVPAPTVALLEGRAHAALGELVEAVERYEVARQPLPDDAPPAYLQAADHAQIEIDALRPRIPKVSVFVGEIPPEAGPGEVRVLLDERPVPPALIGVARTVNPGRHTLRLLVGARELARRDFDIDPFERVQIVLRPRPIPPPPPPLVPAGLRFPGGTRSVLGFTSLTLGVVGIAVGVTAGTLSESDHADLLESCPMGACPPDRHEQIDDFRTMRTVSTIGYIGGAVFTGVGAVLLWSASQELVPADEARLVVGPTAVGLDVAF